MRVRKALAAGISVAALLSTSFGASAQSLAEIEAAAKAEGMLSVIALPDDWCGWRGVIDAFKAKYPEISVNELNPDAGSADEIEAIKANIGNTGPQAPTFSTSASPTPLGHEEGCSCPTRSRCSTRSATTPRTPTATGMAATMACSPSS